MPAITFYEKINKTGPRILLLVLILLIYGQAVFFEKNLDDFLVLGPVEGKIHTFSDLLALLRQPFNQVDYRPVSMFSFGLEQLLFGRIHYGFSHAVNIFLYYLILLSGLKLLKQLLPAEQQPAAWLATLLFACSTVNTEVVASIKSRDTLFSLLFTFLALRQLSLPLRRENAFRFILGFAWFLLALFAKRDSAGLVLFLPGLILLRQKLPVKRLILVLAGVCAVLFLVYQLRSLVGNSVTVPYQTNFSDIGRVTFTENPLSAAFTWPNRIAAALQTNLIYTGKLLCPCDLRFYYGFDHYQLRTFADAYAWLALLIHLAAIAGIFILGRRNRSIWLSALAYACFLAFALNIIEPNAGIVADRYAFQAGIWFWLLIVLAMQPVLRQPVLAIALPAMAVLFAGLSAYRTSAWKDQLTLLQRDMPHLSRSFDAQRMAAGTYLEYFQESNDSTLGHNYLLQALEHARNASQIYPNNVIAHKLEGIAAYNLQQYTDSRKALLRALEAAPDDPELLEILGDLSFVEQDFAKAGLWYSRARAQAPDTDILINKLSSAIYATGHLDSCLRFNLNLIQLEPQRFAPYENLGYFYLDRDDTATAKKYFDLARQKGLTDPAPL